MVGIGALAIPGVGPFFAARPIMAAMCSGFRYRMRRYVANAFSCSPMARWVSVMLPLNELASSSLEMPKSSTLITGARSGPCVRNKLLGLMSR